MASDHSSRMSRPVIRNAVLLSADILSLEKEVAKVYSQDWSSAELSMARTCRWARHMPCIVHHHHSGIRVTHGSSLA